MKSKINLNELAREITLKEGGKINMTIAQVKETMKLTFEALAKYKNYEVERILQRYR